MIFNNNDCIIENFEDIENLEIMLINSLNYLKNDLKFTNSAYMNRLDFMISEFENDRECHIDPSFDRQIDQNRKLCELLNVNYNSYEICDQESTIRRVDVSKSSHNSSPFNFNLSKEKSLLSIPNQDNKLKKSYSLDYIGGKDGDESGGIEDNIGMIKDK